MSAPLDEHPAEPDVDAEGPRDPRTVGRELAEIVERETEPADPDEPELEDDDEDELEPLLREARAAHDSYLAIWAQILPDEQPIAHCGYCDGRGFNPIVLRHDRDSELCEGCDGWGRVDTRSRVADEVDRTCQRCLGRGWVPTVPAVVAPAVDVPEGVPVLPPFEIPPTPVLEPAAG